MGYSNNRNVLPLTEKNNFYTDGCGRNYESKYYVNGAYIDLCGLTPEEYMNNPCCGGSSNSGSSSSKPQNKIIVSSYEENGKIYYQAIANYPVQSTLKIRVLNNENETITELDIHIGETQSEPEEGNSLDIKKVIIDIEEDEDFEYTPIIKDNSNVPENNMYNIYIETIHLNELKDLTGEKIKSLPLYELENGTTKDITFIIPSTDVNVNNIEIEEYNQFCENNQYGFIIILPETVYKNKEYSLFTDDNRNITNKFKYNSSYSIDDKKFVSIIEKANDGDDVSPYAPLYKEDLKYNYKLTIKQYKQWQ